MAQVIENIGGEYRNRTGLHGFAITRIRLIPLKKTVNAPAILVMKKQQVTEQL